MPDTKPGDGKPAIVDDFKDIAARLRLIELEVKLQRETPKRPEPAPIKRDDRFGWRGPEDIKMPSRGTTPPTLPLPKTPPRRSFLPR
jgi:hypothetical protein